MLPFGGPDGKGSSSGDGPLIACFQQDTSADADVNANVQRAPLPGNRSFSCFLCHEILSL